MAMKSFRDEKEVSLIVAFVVRFLLIGRFAFLRRRRSSSMFLLDVIGDVERRREESTATRALPLVLRRNELDELRHGGVLDDQVFLRKKSSF
jgi:hypothetical protein